jgi:glutathione S-transferase
MNALRIAPKSPHCYIRSPNSPHLSSPFSKLVTLRSRLVKVQRIQQLQAHFRSYSSSAMASFYTSETPDVVKNAKGIHLMTANTPNGQKVQILLEELALKYGTTWTFNTINLSENIQKKDWFLAINPNGRIPVIVDNTVSPPFAVHETSSELMYLQSKFDKDNEFGFSDELERADMITWLFFWHGSGAPYQGNTSYFTRAAERSEFAINRFRNETLRVYGVLEIRLSGKYTGEPRDYLAGNGKGKYSIADIGTWGWVKGYSRLFSDEEMKPFPHVKAWVDRIAERPAVQTGISDKYATK